MWGDTPHAPRGCGNQCLMPTTIIDADVHSHHRASVRKDGSACSTALSQVEPTTWNQVFMHANASCHLMQVRMVPRFHNRRVVIMPIDRGPLLFVIFSLTKFTWNQWNQDKCLSTTRIPMQFPPVPRQAHLHGTKWNPWNHNISPGQQVVSDVVI